MGQLSCSYTERGGGVAKSFTPLIKEGHDRFFLVINDQSLNLSEPVHILSVLTCLVI